MLWQAAWRPMLGQLSVLEALVARHGVSRPGGNGSGLPLEPLMRFVGVAAGSANGDVRAAAVKVALQVNGHSFARVLTHA